jgi:glutamate/tyrosine decarboxylase-like PLP-dependent enzyme
MDPVVLQMAIARDREAGCIPVMVIATCGTTNAGMIDPLTECANIAKAADAWFHVDAAWGGALIASSGGLSMLAGIETADSITIDAHKWLATTMGCGMFLTQRAAVLSQAFQVTTSYMPSAAHGIDPYMNSVQWSRRFSGLRLFLNLSVAGWKGYADHVQRTIKAADLLRDLMIMKGWRVVNDSPLAVICMVPPKGSPDCRSIVEDVLRTGRAWVSVATFEGQTVVRACVTHGQTSSADIQALATELTSAACRSET